MDMAPTGKSFQVLNKQKDDFVQCPDRTRYHYQNFRGERLNPKR